MEFRHVAAAAFTLMLAWPSHAAAVELTGAWATDFHDSLASILLRCP